MGVIKDTIMRVVPMPLRLPVWYTLKRVSGTLDDEIAWLNRHISRKRCMIDIGANIGVYSYALRNRCRKIHAFEPQPGCRAVLEAAGMPTVQIHSVALSDTSGTMELHIPRQHGSLIDGLASLRPLEGEIMVEEVRVEPLDSFQFTDVAFIKIDVEGYEMNVLRGALETIRREQPLILIEIEQRHLNTPIEEHFEFFKKEGYAGGFLLGGQWQPLEKFNYEIHQKPYEAAMNAEQYRKIIGSYVCNFIFTPGASK